MDMVMALALSIGILIAAWVKVGPMANLAVPAGIIAWGCFFAAGGKMLFFSSRRRHTISGVFWVWLAMTLIGMMNMGDVAFIIIGIVAFILVMQSKVALLSFIPGAFCGAAVTAWASPTHVRGYVMVGLALLLGAVLGYLSEWAGGMMAKKRAYPA